MSSPWRLLIRNITCSALWFSVFSVISAGISRIDIGKDGDGSPVWRFKEPLSPLAEPKCLAYHGKTASVTWEETHTSQRCWQSQRTRISYTERGAKAARAKLQRIITEDRRPQRSLRQPLSQLQGAQSRSSRLWEGWRPSTVLGSAGSSVPGCEDRGVSEGSSNPLPEKLGQFCMILGAAWSSGSGSGSRGCTAFPPGCYQVQRTPVISCLWGHGQALFWALSISF